MALTRQQRSLFRLALNPALGATIGYIVASWLSHKKFNLTSIIGFSMGAVAIEAWIQWWKKRKTVENQQTTI
jgi:hypothetical protein